MQNLHTKKDHIKVEKIALLLAKAINDDETIYKDVKYTQNDYKQIALCYMDAWYWENFNARTCNR